MMARCRSVSTSPNHARLASHNVYDLALLPRPGLPLLATVSTGAGNDARVGCRMVMIGIEAVTDTALEKIGKRLTGGDRRTRRRGLPQPRHGRARHVRGRPRR